jgi:two-component system OmpR family response regulator
MNKTILVVEDDTETAEYVRSGLVQAGYVVDVLSSGRDALFQASDGHYGAIILDRMLPDLDGLSVLKGLRAAGVRTPILLLSALAMVDERVRGLEAGADDYLVKPFVFSELLARVEVMLRRVANSRETPAKLTCDDLEMNLLARSVTRGGQAIDLLPREFQLLEYLLYHRDQLVTRTMLLERVWDYHFDPSTNIVDVHISRLRQKIDKGFNKPLIHTLRGAGYMLSAKD